MSFCGSSRAADEVVGPHPALCCDASATRPDTLERAGVTDQTFAFVPPGVLQRPLVDSHRSPSGDRRHVAYTVAPTRRRGMDGNEVRRTGNRHLRS